MVQDSRVKICCFSLSTLNIWGLGQVIRQNYFVLQDTKFCFVDQIMNRFIEKLNIKILYPQNQNLEVIMEVRGFRVKQQQDCI